MIPHPFNGGRVANPLPLDGEARKRAGDHVELAYQMAWKHFRACSKSVPLDELRGEALYALSYASGIFDAARGVPFNAYARKVITRRLISVINTWRRSDLRVRRHCRELCGSTKGRRGFPRARTGDTANHAAMREAVGVLRRHLPRRWFDVLYLHYVEEYSVKEVGAALGISPERVRQLVAKAMIRARRRVPLFGWVKVWSQ
jgi:RNA polymerase sigma factor (sigma-70 family)